jgi:hypothetical protein
MMSTRSVGLARKLRVGLGALSDPVGVMSAIDRILWTEHVSLYSVPLITSGCQHVWSERGRNFKEFIIFFHNSNRFNDAWLKGLSPFRQVHNCQSLSQVSEATGAENRLEHILYRCNR